MTRTAVVILNYNGEKLLPQFLPSVVKYSDDADIIVADNGSTDKSLQLLQEKFPDVKIIALEKNYGFCGGYNRAIGKINADYVVLLNSDVEVTQHWLQPMISLLDGNTDIAAVQPKILSYLKKDTFEYAGAGGGFIDSLGYPFCRGRLFDFVEKDLGQYNDTRPIFWATGACMMIRKSVYESFDGLDEALFAHMEEIDMCWKIHRTTNKVYYTGQSTVYHLGAGTLGYESPRKTYLNFRNNLILIFKHFDTAELITKLPLRFLLDWIAALRFLTKGKFSNFKSVFLAQFHFLVNVRKHRLNRKNLRNVFPSYSKESVYQGSAIFDFYIRKKKSIRVQ